MAPLLPYSVVFARSTLQPPCHGHALNGGAVFAAPRRRAPQHAAAPPPSAAAQPQNPAGGQGFVYVGSGSVSLAGRLAPGRRNSVVASCETFDAFISAAQCG
jgi:hypothetical protein